MKGLELSSILIVRFKSAGKNLALFKIVKMSNKKRKKAKRNSTPNSSLRGLHFVQLDRNMIQGVVSSQSSLLYSEPLPYRGVVFAEVLGGGEATRYFSARADNRKASGNTVVQLGKEYDSRPK